MMLEQNSSTEYVHSDQEHEDDLLASQPLTPSFRKGLEVLGSVPIWVLSGLRLEKVGSHRVASNYEMGIYRMERPRDSRTKEHPEN